MKRINVKKHVDIPIGKVQVLCIELGLYGSLWAEIRKNPPKKPFVFDG